MKQRENYQKLSYSLVINNNDVIDHFKYKTIFRCYDSNSNDSTYFIMECLNSENVNYALLFDSTLLDNNVIIFSSVPLKIDRLLLKLKFNTEMDHPIIDPFPFCLRLG